MANSTTGDNDTWQTARLTGGQLLSYRPVGSLVLHRKHQPPRQFSVIETGRAGLELLEKRDGKKKLQAVGLLVREKRGEKVGQQNS